MPNISRYGKAVGTISVALPKQIKDPVEEVRWQDRHESLAQALLALAVAELRRRGYPIEEINPQEDVGRTLTVRPRYGPAPRPRPEPDLARTPPRDDGARGGRRAR